MTHQDPESLPKAAEDAATARGEARLAALRLAQDRGAEFATRPVAHGSSITAPDVEPLLGARAARDIELGARHNARRYIRDAREAGHTWQEIGQALGVTPGGDASQAGETIAEAAYTYAAGHPDTEHARRYGRSVVWRCPSCDEAISDHGPITGPAQDELGHAQGCQRLAETVAKWNAAWEADWEAEP